MKFGSVIALLMGALLALPLSAKEKAEPAVNADTKESFETVSTWVRKQMDVGGRYAYVTAGERSKVNANLEQMGKLFQQRGAVAQMSVEEKTRMFNSQEEVNAILAQRDNERLVCKYERPVGSNIPVKTCKTAGEIEARKLQDRNFMERRQATPQSRPTG